MSLTLADIEGFREFAVRQLNSEGISSLSECVKLWEDEREYEESVAAIRESLKDSAAGRTQPVDEAFAQIRQELGLSVRRSVS